MHRSAYLFLLCTTLLWGGNSVAGKLAVGHISPMTLVFLRWTMAVLIMLPIGWRALREDWPIVRRHWLVLAALGATPVGMPVPQVPEALSKGVIDGTILPYEVMPALKVDELTKFHSGPDASQPLIYNSVFVIAMNKARYESLPADIRKIIDSNSW